jgi:hypothetical protein
VSDIEAYERSIIRLTQADSLHSHSFPNNLARAGQDGDAHSISGRIGYSSDIADDLPIHAV